MDPDYASVYISSIEYAGAHAPGEDELSPEAQVLFHPGDKAVQFDPTTQRGAVHLAMFLCAAANNFSMNVWKNPPRGPGDPGTLRVLHVAVPTA